jgi:uncharacterized protein YggE
MANTAMEAPLKDKTPGPTTSSGEMKVSAVVTVTFELM